MLGWKREVISQKRGEFVAMEHALVTYHPSRALQPVLMYCVWFVPRSFEKPMTHIN